MKKQFDPHQMTLSQFLLFLIVGGVLLIFLILEIYMHLRVGGEKIYMVRSYAALDRAVSHTESLYLPEKSALPEHEETDFFVRTSSNFKLYPVKDGYEIHLGGDDSYSILCARENDPSFDDNLPLRTDQTLRGTDLEIESTDSHVRVFFLKNGWFYRLYGRRGDDDTIDYAAALNTLMNLSDNILEQAG